MWPSCGAARGFLRSQPAESIRVGPLQVSLSQEELQALGSAISMVTQGRALAGPEEELAGGDTHTVIVADTGGAGTQPVHTQPGPSLLPAQKLPARRELHCKT